MRKDALVVLLLTFLVLGGLYWFGFVKSTDNYANNQQILVNKDNNKNQVLTVATVSQHNIPTDCYLVIKGQVYDVSSYINHHPGGRRTITSRCGREVTGIFAAIHSNFAWNLLADYQIGTIGDNKPVDQTKTADVQTTLEEIELAINEQLPSAEIINIKPSRNKYLAKIIYENQLMELHLNESGQILQREVADDEFDWNYWDSDIDDQ